MNRRLRFSPLLDALLLIGVAAITVYAQSEGLAPQIPSYRQSLDLFVRERNVSSTEGAPLRLIRYGKAGDLEQPGVLDLPFEGRSTEVRAYDWLIAGDRSVELRRLPGYAAWIELAERSQLLVIHEQRAELVYGTAILSGDEAYESVVRVGSFSIRGDGRSILRRDAAGVRILVDSGRFEISRDGVIVASLGAGQERAFALDETDRADGEGLVARYDALVDALDSALFDGWSSGALVLEGSVLVPIWERTRAVLPVYARASAERVQWIEYPDVWERRIGEALRILAAYSFLPEMET